MRHFQTGFEVQIWRSDMNIRHLARILFAILIAFLFHSQQALASTPAPDQCIYVLDPTAANALNLSGAISINAPSCGAHHHRLLVL
jgi:hypothetical protein